MIDEGMELLQSRVQQAIELIERLRKENENLKNKIARMQNEIQQLKEEADALKEEKEAIRGKIDTAVSMLDEVDLEERAKATDTESEDDSAEE